MGSTDALREMRATLVSLILARGQWDVELKFPIEFKIESTPLSLQASSLSRERWKQQVKVAASTAAGSSTWATGEPVFVTIFYFPFGPMQGDVDNIVKPILDGMNGPIYMDDRQIQRVIVQKFEGEGFRIDSPTPTLIDATDADPPVVYIRIDNDSSTGN